MKGDFPLSPSAAFPWLPGGIVVVP